MVAGAVILHSDLTGSEDWLELLDDSKKLTRLQREQAAAVVKENAVAWGLGQVEPLQIDLIGIGRAAFQAMMLAVANMASRPAHLLLDYIHVRDCPYQYDTIVKGDSVSYSIAAASNIAKVARDLLMREYEEQYPGYAFAKNKGYPTMYHMDQLRELGPCDIHRRSFAPVAQARMVFGSDN